MFTYEIELSTNNKTSEAAQKFARNISYRREDESIRNGHLVAYLESRPRLVLRLI